MVRVLSNQKPQTMMMDSHSKGSLLPNPQMSTYKLETSHQAHHVLMLSF